MVIVNLTISGVARLLAVARLRSFVNRRRALWLVLGCVPGLLIGLFLRDAVDESVLKVGAGTVAVAVAAYLLFRPRPVRTTPAHRPACSRVSPVCSAASWA